jgi:hypothetical protein
MWGRLGTGDSLLRRAVSGLAWDLLFLVEGPAPHAYLACIVILCCTVFAVYKTGFRTVSCVLHIVPTKFTHTHTQFHLAVSSGLLCVFKILSVYSEVQISLLGYL